MPSQGPSLFDYLAPPERDLASRFFGAFALAEYRLKSLGYIRRGRDDAQADWDAFANSISARFRRAPSALFRRAWVELTEQPPRKQVVVDGALGWKDVPRPAGASDAAWGLVLVRRVRNNLFHGAKFILGGEAAFARDRQLVSAALTVLDHAMRLAKRRPRPASRKRAA